MSNKLVILPLLICLSFSCTVDAKDLNKKEQACFKTAAEKYNIDEKLPKFIPYT